MDNKVKGVEIDPVREKLIELVGQVQDCGCDVTDVIEMNYVENITLIDHLIANGVTFAMDINIFHQFCSITMLLIFFRYVNGMQIKIS